MGSMENLFEYSVKGALVLLGVAAAAAVLVPFGILYLAWRVAEWSLGFFGSFVFPLEEEQTIYGGYRMSGFARLYYWLFPKKLEEKRERKRAEKKAQEDRLVSDLLYEYEKLLKRREELEETVQEKADALRDFSSAIEDLKRRDAYVERRNRKGGRKIIESFNMGDLETYEEIKELAVELENANFRIFAIKQELKMHGYDRGDDDD